MRSWIDMNNKQRSYFNRELSWVEFNARVLDRVLDPQTPLLERVKFSAIVSSNFDEFFRVRVAGLKRQVRDGNALSCPSGISPSEQLRLVGNKIAKLKNLQDTVFTTDLLPSLKSEGVVIMKCEALSAELIEDAHRYFREVVFPILTPVRIEQGSRFPFIANLDLYTAFVLEKASTRQKRPVQEIAVVKIPEIIGRLVEIQNRYFILLEDLITFFAEELFPGYNVSESLVFRITRDADLGVDEGRDEDFVEAMAEVVSRREESLPVRIEDGGSSARIRKVLVRALGLSAEDVYESVGALDHTAFMTLADLSGVDHLRYEPWMGYESADLLEDIDIWEQIKARDILLHHPYDTFAPVVRLVEEGAEDPDVLAIKMTLYRTSGDSPIVRALERAAMSGKQVTAVVELKARFDEQRNIGWAKTLEQAGVIVVYGVAQLKIHAKALLIIRRERGGIVRYLHMSTGNYNEKTARLYTDFGLITADERLTSEATLLFNAITGYSSAPELSLLSMAPLTLKRKLLELIEREIQRHSTADPGLIMAKLNSLADPEIIDALYRASRAGVVVKLNIRGICMLVPGIPGMSENITVVSIVDRYLEHSRIVLLRNGGNREVYLSSADWMPRNLDRRVELLFPVLLEEHRRRLRETLDIYFKDTENAYRLLPTGEYEKEVATETGGPFRAQQAFNDMARRQAEIRETSRKREMNVRRSAPER